MIFVGSPSRIRATGLLHVNESGYGLEGVREKAYANRSISVGNSYKSQHGALEAQVKTSRGQVWHAG